MEGSANDSADGVARTLGKEVAIACFSFKADALLDPGGIGEVK